MWFLVLVSPCATYHVLGYEVTYFYIADWCGAMKPCVLGLSFTLCAAASCFVNKVSVASDCICQNEQIRKRNRTVKKSCLSHYIWAVCILTFIFILHVGITMKLHTSAPDLGIWLMVKSTWSWLTFSVIRNTLDKSNIKRKRDVHATIAWDGEPVPAYSNRI